MALLVENVGRSETIQVWISPQKPGEKEYRYYGADGDNGVRGSLTLLRRSRIILNTGYCWKDMITQYERWLHKIR